MAAENLTTFTFNKQNELVEYIETTHVSEGVICHIYRFKATTGKDLGIVDIQAGYRTPLQRILAGEQTIEGYISGKGFLTITTAAGDIQEYRVDETSIGFYQIVNIGETMQWKADVESPLTIYEICLPPYEDGRFENIDEIAISQQ